MDDPAAPTRAARATWDRLEPGGDKNVKISGTARRR
jgi:hypothetical protein